MNNESKRTAQIVERISALKNMLKINNDTVLFADFCFEDEKYVEILPLPQVNKCEGCEECNQREQNE
jgi:hypothetical protein